MPFGVGEVVVVVALTDNDKWGEGCIIGVQ